MIDVLGLSAEELQTAYTDAAPFAYPASGQSRPAPRGMCPPQHVRSDGPGAWAEQIYVDCGREDATAFGYGAVTVERRFDIPEPGTYRFDVSGDGAMSIIRCVADELALRPEEVDAVGHEVNVKLPIRIEPGGQTVELAAADSLRVRAIAEYSGASLNIEITKVD